MNWQRKFKRDKSHHKIRKKTPSKLSSKGLIIFIGAMMVCFGVFYGGYNYNIYINGRPEHTTQSNAGLVFHSEVAPGQVEWKESATICFAIAGAGVLLIIISLIVSKILRYLKPLEKKQLTFSY